jgi:signal transduction histidine kinase
MTGSDRARPDRTRPDRAGADARRSNTPRSNPHGSDTAEAGTTSPRAARSSRLTVRGRLTLVYTTVFALGGLLLLGLNYLIVADSLLSRIRAVEIAVRVDGQELPPGMSPAATSPPGDPEVVATRPSAATALDEYRAGVLSDLLVRSAMVLVGAVILAVVAGWLIAGRALRRLHRITDTARDLSEHDLGRRLALSGPQDELKDLGDTFDGMLDRLQAAFDSQRRFAANASHELRTPLAVQRAAIEVPLVTGQVPAHLLPAIHRVLQATERSERLIEGLLLLARSEQGTVRRLPVDLAVVAKEVCEMVTERAETRGVEVRTRLTHVEIDGDPVLLEHLVRNLVDNAVRYNEPGGWVAVGTRRRAGAAEVVVTNTGPQVNGEEADRLFLPFHRSQGQRLHRHDEGAGLGLSIVRSIAAAHGGTVTAHPRPEGGLTITVRFTPMPGSDGADGRHPDGHR